MRIYVAYVEYFYRRVKADRFDAQSDASQVFGYARARHSRHGKASLPAMDVDGLSVERNAIPIDFVDVLGEFGAEEEREIRSFSEFEDGAQDALRRSRAVDHCEAVSDLRIGRESHAAFGVASPDVGRLAVIGAAGRFEGGGRGEEEIVLRPCV